MIYTGIGSRKTPLGVQNKMRQLGEALAREGWKLRSGGASGADSAFEVGCDAAGGKKEIYLPWHGFNNRMVDYAAGVTVLEGVFQVEAALRLAAAYHPKWESLSPQSRALMARNGPQVLGETLRSPSSIVFFWTETGGIRGGTGQALRIAARPPGEISPIKTHCVREDDDVAALVRLARQAAEARRRLI